LIFYNNTNPYSASICRAHLTFPVQLRAVPDAAKAAEAAAAVH
jgi:hypothetical protein